MKIRSVRKGGEHHTLFSAASVAEIFFKSIGFSSPWSLKGRRGGGGGGGDDFSQGTMIFRDLSLSLICLAYQTFKKVNLRKQ